jgi:uncharacterized protein YbjT (DUF2867 family)
MQNLLATVRDGAIYTAAGDGRVAMVDARDVATVPVAALTGDGNEGKIYTLAGPEALSFDGRRPRAPGARPRLRRPATGRHAPAAPS